MKLLNILKESSLKEENPCWKGYRQLGMKMKNGKRVPNCVKESLDEGSEFWRLPKKTIGNDFYAVRNNIDSMYDYLSSGGDLEMERLDLIIKRLQNIRRQAKKFGNPQAVKGTMYEMKNLSKINEEEEGYMYIPYLENIIEYSEYLLDTIDDSDDIPAWIQDKIVIAHHNLEASANYYDIETEDDNFNESKKTMKFESEYKDFFRKALDREGKSISSMSNQEKKDFFNRIDSQWKAKNESVRKTKNCCKG